ncbi:hypothetical protein KPL71_014419 [Citrus sinensis]|uniref:Uncharacterized protein n=1 Tax=Citrus sinensis TaxID=2711 RepID=A0ACB8KBI2_CITSI|nr:hypothetical protein KPL71_014419 [Citrus sinensis]
MSEVEVMVMVMDEVEISTTITPIMPKEKAQPEDEAEAIQDRECRAPSTRIEERVNYVEEKNGEDGTLLLACNDTSGGQENTWYLDTGASNHMNGNISMFMELSESVNGSVTFGDDSKVLVKGKDKSRAKLDEKSEKFIFIGYDNNSKGYKLYNPNIGKIVISRDVVFDEERECDFGSVNFQEVALGEKWRIAMDEEIKAIVKNDTWELTTFRKGHKAIGVKWVYKMKRNVKGEIKRHKARLVAKGYSQKAGIDYDEVFAPVARLETIRLIISLAAQNKWKIFKWIDPSLFEEFKRVIIKEFEMTDIGLMAYYLDIEVKQNEVDIFISQESYVKEILKRFKMNNCKPISTPVECRVKLSKHDEGEDIDPTFFKSLVGSLRYLTCTGPNILYVVGLVSRYMEKSKTTHFKAAKRILRYIKGTINFGLLYSFSNDYKLVGYSDSH